MKNNVIILVCSLLCFLCISPIEAQTNAPTIARMEYLIEYIKNCKKDLEEAENNLRYLVNNLGVFTIEDYSSTRNSIKIGNKCINDAQAELDKLKKDYPEWFGSPDSVMVVNGERIWFYWFDEQIAIMTAVYAAMIKVFVGIDEPQN